ncbi:MAG: Uma2 family endonuclease [Pseudanabaena sp.]
MTTTKLTVSTPTKYRLSVEQYYKMAEVGILGIEQRTELIEGEIIEMSAIGTKHAICVSNLAELLTVQTIQIAHVRQQNPIHLSDRSEPQPDIVLVKRPSSRYADCHPQPEDIFLLIEVSDSTLKYDREVKLPLYVKAGIAEVWIVNIEEQVFEVYSSLNQDRYEQVKIYGKGEVVSMSMFENIVISVNEIFEPVEK